MRNMTKVAPTNFVIGSVNYPAAEGGEAAFADIAARGFLEGRRLNGHIHH